MDPKGIRSQKRNKKTRQNNKEQRILNMAQPCLWNNYVMDYQKMRKGDFTFIEISQKPEDSNVA